MFSHDSRSYEAGTAAGIPTAAVALRAKLVGPAGGIRRVGFLFEWEGHWPYANSRLARRCLTRNASEISLSFVATTAHSQASDHGSRKKCTARSTFEPFFSVFTIFSLRRVPAGSTAGA